MTGNNTNDMKNVNSGIKIKTEHKDHCSTIPASWKKFGEVYYNELDQPVFVCSICIEDAENIDTTFFTTYDVSEFLFHLQHHFITIYSKSVDGISTKRSRCTQKEAHSYTNSEDTDIHPVKIEKNQIGTLDDYHEKLVDNVVSSQTKELYQLDIKEEIQDDYWEQSLPNNFDKEDNEDFRSNIREEEMSRYTFSNSNYYYDDQTYKISDNEDNDNNEGFGNEDFGIDETREVADFRKQNEFIEISDDEETNPNFTFSAKTRKTKDSVHTKEDNATDVDIYFYKCTICRLAFGQRIDLLKHMRSHKKEENSLSKRTLSSHPVNSIPTPDASPCESTTDQRSKKNSNRHHYNYYADRHYKDSDRNQSHYQRSSKHQSKPMRPFRSFQCKICGKRTATENTMQIHQRRFHSALIQEGSATNQYTSEQFHQVPQPEQHLRQRTSDRGVKGQLLSRPFQCKVCNKRTGTQQAMKLHQQRFHSPASHLITTQCEICHKRIFTPKIQQHMIVHRAAQYKCDYCGLIYKHKQSLTIHVKKFHPNSTPVY